MRSLYTDIKLIIRKMAEERLTVYLIKEICVEACDRFALIPLAGGSDTGWGSVLADLFCFTLTDINMVVA